MVRASKARTWRFDEVHLAMTGTWRLDIVCALRTGGWEVDSYVIHGPSIAGAILLKLVRVVALVPLIAWPRRGLCSRGRWRVDLRRVAIVATQILDGVRGVYTRVLVVIPDFGKGTELDPAGFCRTSGGGQGALAELVSSSRGEERHVLKKWRVA